MAKNVGSRDNLVTKQANLMKIGTWLDGNVQIMQVVLFLLFDFNYGCYGNGNSENMANHT